MFFSTEFRNKNLFFNFHQQESPSSAGIFKNFPNFSAISLRVIPPLLLIPLMDMSKEHLSSAVTVSVFILNFLFDIHQVFSTNVPLKIFTKMFSGRLKIFLVILKYSGLVVLPKVVGKDVGVHQCTPALAKDVQALLQELDLNPGHVVLLHLLHLVLHHGVQLAFKLERLEVVHVPIAVEEVPLQGTPTLLLVISVNSCLILVIPVAVVPGAGMWLPWSQAHPAEVRLAGLVLADHVVATSILLYGSSTLWALLGVGRDPVTGLTVVIALLDPLLDEVAPHRVVPVL